MQNTRAGKGREAKVPQINTKFILIVITCRWPYGRIVRIRYESKPNIIIFTQVILTLVNFVIISVLRTRYRDKCCQVTRPILTCTHPLTFWLFSKSNYKLWVRLTRRHNRNWWGGICQGARSMFRRAMHCTGSHSKWRPIKWMRCMCMWTRPFGLIYITPGVTANAIIWSIYEISHDSRDAPPRSWSQ